jgi:predicted NBD/HSP70 family sugar kinase
MYGTDGINQERQQQLNRSLAISLLRREGTCTRSELAKLSGLNPATITNIINEFISCGIVIETGALLGKKNRRAIGIRLNGKSFRVIGVMLTRRHYYILSMGLSGEIYDVKKYKIKDKFNASGTIGDIKSNIHAAISSDGNKVLAIGVAMPGPYMPTQREMLFLINLPYWDSVSVYDEFQEGFSIPVFIANDANAGAYAQMLYRDEGLQSKNLVYIVAGQGIGCGMIVNGNIISGELGLAGEIGHTSINIDGNLCECGNRGCLETYCSTIALEKKLKECIENGEETILDKDFVWDDVVHAVRRGDELACREYRAACRYLAAGIVNIVNQINPEVVVIGDQLAEVQPEIMVEIINDHIKNTVRPFISKVLKIEINKLKVNPALIGAAVIATQEIYKEPFKYLNINGAEKRLSG